MKTQGLRDSGAASLTASQQWELVTIWAEDVVLFACFVFGFQVQFSSVQLLSCVRLFATPWAAAHQAPLSITNSELDQTHVHRIGDAIQPPHPLLSPSPPAFNLCQHQGLFK